MINDVWRIAHGTDGIGHTLGNLCLYKKQKSFYKILYKKVVILYNNEYGEMDMLMNPITTLLVYHCGYRNNFSVVDVNHKIFDAKSVIRQENWQLFYKISFALLLKSFKK